jgi:hypothetical protein
MNVLSKVLVGSALVLAAGFSTAGSKTAGDKPDTSKVATDGEGPAVLWREPKDIAARDLYYGPGGKAHEPRGTFTFLKEDSHGSNPKFDVVDQEGVKWRVKLGNEARPEVVASRFVWAVGYFANEDYFVPVLKVQDMQQLNRGSSRISSDGTVRNVRLKRTLEDQKKIGIWAWADNPFKGTRPWYGLQVLMALMNSWDLKDSNNAVYQVTNPLPEQHYMVSDLGSTFGAIRWSWNDKGNIKSYSHSRWISSTSKDKVDFSVPAAPGPPFFLNFVKAPVHFRIMWIGRNVPIADARWMGQLLGQLSPKQIRDAFRAGGFSPDEVERFSVEVEKRIAELKNL